MRITPFNDVTLLFYGIPLTALRHIYINSVVPHSLDFFGVDFGVNVVNLMEIIWVMIG